MNTEYIGYAERVHLELNRLLGDWFSRDIDISYPYVDKSIPLVVNKSDYPFKVNRLAEDCYHDVGHLERVSGLGLYYYWRVGGESALVSNGVVVVLSGLLHDLEHSLGVKSDRENIEDTVERVKELFRGKSGVYLNSVIKAIRDTEFIKGDRLDRSKLNWISKSLIDADRTEALINLDRIKITDKLFKEINLAKREIGGEELSYSEFKEHQLDYLLELECYTNTARGLVESIKHRMLESACVE